MIKLKNGIVFGACLVIYNLSEREFDKKENINTNKNKIEFCKSEMNFLKHNHIASILQAEKYIFREQIKHKLNISIPFNRTIRYIYDLPFYYIDYENYNFNKLSDLFLNIHIFIN